jgi:5-deoxy-glucuronate isomerase
VSALPAAAPPNHLPNDALRLRPGAGGDVWVDPERAGWRYLSFRTAVLSFGESLPVERPAHEAAIVTIAGGLRADLDGHDPIELPGRASVWDGLPWALYLPPDIGARITPLGERAVIALAEAPASGREGVAGGPLVIGPSDVRVEIRGAGNATRQINHIIAPDFPADRLEVVEVYTPSGNWSSWPPHKHDTDAMPHEAVLEEIYAYRFRRPDAWGIQRLYRADGSRDALWVVRDGEVVLVTDGYHPFVATHGDDAYYLNALAGDRRTMACSYDPAHEGVREAWTSMEPDPRLPLVR